MEKWNKHRYSLTSIITILGLITMILFNHFTFYTNTSAKMQNMGMGNLNQVSQAIENHLTKNIYALQTTTIALEYMLNNNVPKEEIENLLIYESNRYVQEIDDNFSGIYGVFNGEYMHGGGWIPDKEYIPQERDWFLAAQEANGKAVLVAPYTDQITGDVILSISKSFSNNSNVVSIDITLDEIQQILEQNVADSLGYTFIIDKNGLVISHSNKNENHKNYLADEQMNSAINKILSNKTTYFSEELGDKECQVLSNEILNDWYVVTIFDRKQFFHDVNLTLLRNILFFGFISALIIFFYLYTIKTLKKSMQLELESQKRIEETNLKMIRALVRTIDAKDRYTNGHSIRVAEYAQKIAAELGKSPEEQRIIYYSGLLHDVGKIRVPEDIINKPGKLTTEEFEQIKIHPVTGYRIVKDIYDNKVLAQGVKFHHERYDGKGYPSGLRGDNIPEIARIIGVADTYDAMASNRSYRKALPQEIVRQEIENGKGTQFDPQIADIILRMIDNDNTYNMRENDGKEKTILFVDDDSMNIKITELIMKDEPMYKLISATSGTEALNILDKIKIDLIILDVEMPDMDGFETLSKIKSKYNIPVAFMTGNKDLETIQAATELGVDDYISKPIIPLVLKETIHSIFSESANR